MKRFFFLLLSIFLTFAASAQPYTSGVFLLNEDWYGHNNSTINFIHDDGTIDYRIFQKANTTDDLTYTLGCTAQFAQLFFDKMFIISKQDQDPGESATMRGARIVVADPETMTMIARIDTIFTINGNSAADGRGFAGVSQSKGYVGTSNGIFVLDFNSWQITGRIPNTENPLIVGGEANADGIGPLYHNQIGTILAIGSDGREIGYSIKRFRSSDDEAEAVYAIYQDRGLLRIDPHADTIISVLPGCFSTMTLSADGTLWIARNTNTEAQEYPYGMSGELWDGYELIAIDTKTGLPFDTVDLCQFGVTDLMVEQNWYSWTAGAFCASMQENVLYWVASSRWDWFGGKQDIWKYDINKRTAQVVFSTAADNNTIYGAAMRVDPRNDDLYFSTYHGSNIATNRWQYYRRTADGEVTTISPIRNYWYPALYLFPDDVTTALEDIESRTLLAQPKKIIRNNQLLILLPDGTLITSDGRRL